MSDRHEERASGKTLEERFKQGIRPIFTNFWGVVFALLLVGASAVCAGALLMHVESDRLFWATAALWAAWALLPPFFFLMQWTAFEGGPEELARLKYNHELASKFWLGGVGILSAVLLYAQNPRNEPTLKVVVTASVEPAFARPGQKPRSDARTQMPQSPRLLKRQLQF